MNLLMVLGGGWLDVEPKILRRYLKAGRWARLRDATYAINNFFFGREANPDEHAGHAVDPLATLPTAA